MNKIYCPEARKDHIVVQETEDELLVYDLVTNNAVYLNESSKVIWRSCNGKRNIAQIADDVSVKLGELVDEELISLALSDLIKHGLIREPPDPPELYPGVSRREMIRQVGLGSVVALPLVSSLVAPSAAHANSSCVSGGMCSCTVPSAGMQGQICTPSMSCMDMNCQCAWENNGNNMGVCVA